MQKTRVGITVGALGAVTYFLALFSGYLATLLLVAYILLFETNPWLRRTAVKATVIMFCFALLKAILGFVPDVVGLIGNMAALFKVSFSAVLVNNLFALINNGISFVEKILFLGLGFKAIRQGTIVIPFFDGMVSRFMD